MQALILADRASNPGLPATRLAGSMSYARTFCLALGLASGCAGETFDLLGNEESVAGDGGRGGDALMAGSAGRGGRGGTAGSGGVPQATAGAAGGNSCPNGNCNPFSCEKSSDCKSEYAPVCLQSQGRCVGCLPEDDRCTFGFNCDPLTYSCMLECDDEDDTQFSKDCPNSRPHCESGRGVCVECLEETHCLRPGAPHCAFDKTCVECRNNRECDNALQPICQRPALGFVPYTCRACANDFECEGRRCTASGSCVPFESTPEP